MPPWFPVEILRYTSKMMDIVIPNNNEKELIEIAEKIGFKQLILLYNYGDFQNKNKNKFENKRINIQLGILADSKNINNLKDKIKGKNAFIAIKSSENDREVIEKSKANLIFSLETSGKKDFIHQRGSGLNHILCKLAKEKNIIIGFSFHSILNSNKKYEIFGRMNQNIRLCRKFKVKTAIASFAKNPYQMRAPKDLISLFTVLGMSQKEAQDSLLINF